MAPDDKISDWGQDNALGRALGWDVRCFVKIREGGRVHISGFTKDARNLVGVIMQAVDDGIRPVPPRRT